MINHLLWDDVLLDTYSKKMVSMENISWKQCQFLQPNCKSFTSYGSITWRHEVGRETSLAYVKNTKGLKVLFLLSLFICRSGYVDAVIWLRKEICFWQLLAWKVTIEFEGQQIDVGPNMGFYLISGKLGQTFTCKT